MVFRDLPPSEQLGSECFCGGGLDQRKEERHRSEILGMFLSSRLRFEQANPCSALGRSVFSLTPHLLWPLQNAAHCPILWKWTHAAFLSINFRYIQAPKIFGANALDSAHFWYRVVVFMSVLTSVSYNCIVKASTTLYLITWCASSPNVLFTWWKVTIICKIRFSIHLFDWDKCFLSKRQAKFPVCRTCWHDKVPGGLWQDWEELQEEELSFADWRQMMSSVGDGTARQARFNPESPRQIRLYSSNTIYFHSPQFLHIIRRQMLKHERLIFKKLI